jgi:hypothetical protein
MLEGWLAAMRLEGARRSGNIEVDCLGIRTRMSDGQEQVDLAFECHALLREGRERAPESTRLVADQWFRENNLSPTQRVASIADRARLLVDLSVQNPNLPLHLTFDSIFGDRGGLLHKRTLMEQVELLRELRAARPDETPRQRVGRNDKVGGTELKMPKQPDVGSRNRPTDSPPPNSTGGASRPSGTDMKPHSDTPVVVRKNTAHSR